MLLWSSVAAVESRKVHCLTEWMNRPAGQSTQQSTLTARMRLASHTQNCDRADQPLNRDVMTVD